MTYQTTPWWLLALFVFASCATPSDVPEQSSAAFRYCPEATWPDFRGDPRNAAGYIRYCWPGEPSCYCDRDNDCYALDGYVACVNPLDGGGDASADADRLDASDVSDADRLDASDVSDADRLDASDADRLDASDADRLDASDADRLDASDADRLDASDADRLDVSDADRLDVSDADRLDASDAFDVADTTTDQNHADTTSEGARFCPEAVFPDFRGDPRNAAGYIRYCWPGEPSCYCDRDNDCYRLSGYVPCIPVGSDASTEGGVDTGADTSDASSMDAAMDLVEASQDGAGSHDVADVINVCPGPVVIGSNGQPYDPVTYGLRQCFPGERYCFCDVWNDCYARSGYVPCVRTDAGVYDAGSCDAGSNPPSSDAGALPVDPVTYSGTLTNAPGYRYASITVAGLARDVWYYVPYRACTRPALLLAFHGATGNGNEVMQQMDAQHVAERFGAVVIAPSARFMSAAQGDFSRPSGNAIYWETWPNNDPDSNPDLLLTRALIKEAQRAFGTDPDRTYVVGYSNGGFMAINVAVTLHDRIAAWATTNSGMVPCTYRLDCGFTGTALSCAALQMQPNYCNCTGPDKPTPLPPTFRRPAYISNSVRDTVVSVYYGCTLAQRLAALSVPHVMDLWSGEHQPRDGFLIDAWQFMAQYVR
jgi:predicted esterase